MGPRDPAKLFRLGIREGGRREDGLRRLLLCSLCLAGYFAFTQAWEKRKVPEVLTSPAECWLTHLCNGDSSLWADGA